jgi:hypothetical protein
MAAGAREERGGAEGVGAADGPKRDGDDHRARVGLLGSRAREEYVLAANDTSRNELTRGGMSGGALGEAVGER